MLGERVTCDTAVYRGSFYGILNARGQFWTPLIFDSEAKARMHIGAFWGNNHAQRDECLRTFKVVPVRAVVTVLDEENPHVG